MSKGLSQTTNYSQLINELSSLIENGRRAAVRQVNTTLIATYWLIGRRIVEYEQKGKERAQYGLSLLKNIADDLTKRFGKGFTERNLEHMRQFYVTYSKVSHTPRAKSIKKSHTVRAESVLPNFSLTWSHYRLLMRLEDSYKRDFYEAECLRGNWSIRQLGVNRNEENDDFSII